MRIAIPDWANFIDIGSDKSIWAHRYDPQVTRNTQSNRYNKHATQHTGEQLIGYHTKKIVGMPAYSFKLPGVISTKSKPDKFGNVESIPMCRFINNDLEIVVGPVNVTTQEEITYKAFKHLKWIETH